MNKLALTLCLSIIFLACDEEKQRPAVDFNNWEKRTLTQAVSDSLEQGTSYLAVYSEIYHQTEQNSYDLTVSVSMRNTSLSDSIYIDKATYYNTSGELIHTYFDQTIFIAPLETVEIVIDEADRSGGTGANFLFDWRIKPGGLEPLFEGVMISTYGAQGLSFTTQGLRIK